MYCAGYRYLYRFSIYSVYKYYTDQRVCTSRGEIGGGPLFFHVKLNLIDPCRTVRASTRVEGCQAGGLGHQFQYMREYNAESPKQGRKRFNFIVKTINSSHLPLIYLWVIGVQVRQV